MEHTPRIATVYCEAINQAFYPPLKEGMALSQQKNPPKYFKT
jgi:hypothetical protein